MDSQPKKRVSPLTLVLVLIIVLLAGAAVFLAVGKFGGEFQPDAENLGDGNTPLLGYEEGITVVDDPDAFNKAVEDAFSKAEEGIVPLEYLNDGHSTDGKIVECYIANPLSATYDIYIQIFADDTFSDQIYLSGLIPPGKAIRELTLDHSLEKGDHRVYVIYTQVGEDHKTIHGQVTVTMDFYVG